MRKVSGILTKRVASKTGSRSKAGSASAQQMQNYLAKLPASQRAQVLKLRDALDSTTVTPSRAAGWPVGRSSAPGR